MSEMCLSFDTSIRGLLGCDTVYCCGRIPLHLEHGGNTNLWSVGILP